MNTKKGFSHKILIVDDDTGLRDSLKLRLEVEGYYTRAVATARDALQEMETSTRAYDLVLMDQRLETSWAGIEATRKITESWPDTEVVVITGYGDREASVAAIEAGACRYVYKTGEVVSEIINIVEALDDMRELERQLRDPSEERDWLQNIILEQGTGIAIVDRSYRVLYLNDEGREIVDQDARIGGICWVEFYGAHAQDKPCRDCPTQALFKGSEPGRVIKISTGGDKYIEMTATPLKKEGRIIGAIKAGIDVTDREQLCQMESGMIGTLSLDERLEVILQGIRMLGYDRIRLYLLSPDGKVLIGEVEVGGIGNASFQEIWLSLDEDKYSDHTLRERKPFKYRGNEHGPMPPVYDLLDKNGVPWIDLPLLVGEEPIGIISIDNKVSRNPLVVSDLKRLMPFANSAAMAIKTARDHNMIRDRALELEKLREIDAEITRTLEQPKVLQKIVEACLELTGADSADIRLRRGESLVRVAGSGWFSTSLRMKSWMSQEHIPLVWVAKKGERYLANQAQKDEYIIRLHRSPYVLLLKFSANKGAAQFIFSGVILVKHNDIELHYLVQTVYNRLKNRCTSNFFRDSFSILLDDFTFIFRKLVTGANVDKQQTNHPVFCLQSKKT